MSSQPVFMRNNHVVLRSQGGDPMGGRGALWGYFHWAGKGTGQGSESDGGFCQPRWPGIQYDTAEASLQVLPLRLKACQCIEYVYIAGRWDTSAE